MAAITREGRLTIGVGQILDKYELLEKVGQGGMAVVYRGVDRSLKRQVAVKVLHRHLAEHQEARDRFEREAQAVAKLRHENILEIFDFSGTSADESYIVTEFIQGQTLKQFITDHRIKYPEVAAMIAVQVCKALGHAHGLGILHRDIKPENIMIRDDGVVKLMDFGIAQMLDLQRMTVTGQLLGSPAYMAPEHVEGGQLDFRTDVFAVGILLYQLVTGELPFQGKNPHEILKRIAEGRYTDPRQVAPQVGNQLGRIIARALEREQKDRYADIAEMMHALEVYLEGSGLSDWRGELGRFFSAPVSYEMALGPRLVDHLTRRGRELLDTDRVAALELFNRVLTIEPDNRAVLAEIDRLSRRRRGAQLALLAAGVLAAGAGAYVVRGHLLSGDGIGPVVAATPPEPIESALGPGGDHADAAAVEPGLGTSSDSGGAGAGPSAAPADAGVAALPTSPPDAAPRVAEVSRLDLGRDRPVDRRPVVEPPADAAVPAPRVSRRVTLTVFPRNSEYRVDGGPWQTVDGQRVTFEVGTGRVPVEVRNPACCESQSAVIGPDEAAPRLDIQLAWMPGKLVPRCDVPGVTVHLDGRPARLGRPNIIPIGAAATGERTVKVTFFTGDKFSQDDETVQYNETKVVTCRFE